MLKIAVLVSGGGTNLQAIIDCIQNGRLPNTEIEVVISSNKNAYALKRAEHVGIPTEILHRKDFLSKEAFDTALLQVLDRYNPDLLVMAGFMVLLGEGILSRYPNRILNVHPSLIPAFSGDGCYGLIPHRMALEYGVKLVGATVHFVEAKTDGGPIIFQGAIPVMDDDTPETLQKRVMEEVEWKLLPKAILYFGEGRLVTEGRRVRIIEKA